MQNYFFQLNSQITKWRQELHKVPEIGLTLPKTLAYLEQELTKLKINFTIAGGGIIANISGTNLNSKKIIAFRADMDALPIQEIEGRAYGSKISGRMHACGHDAHMASLLALAHLYSNNPPEFNVRLIFQPGEEGYFGAKNMIAAGALHNVSAIFACHVGSPLEESMPGMAISGPGTVMAYIADCDISFNGAGTHAAMPHYGRDPITAVSQFILAVQCMRSREIEPQNPIAISVCAVNAGNSYNVVPNDAHTKITIRTLDAKTQNYAKKRLEQIAAGIAQACDLKYSCTWEPGYDAVINDNFMYEIFNQAATKCLGEKAVIKLTKASLGGEDMAYYLQLVPGCFWAFDSRNPSKNIIAPNHSPKFDVDEDTLWKPAWVNAEIGLEWWKAVKP